MMISKSALNELKSKYPWLCRSKEQMERMKQSEELKKSVSSLRKRNESILSDVEENMTLDEYKLFALRRVEEKTQGVTSGSVLSYTVKKCINTSLAEWEKADREQKREQKILNLKNRLKMAIMNASSKRQLLEIMQENPYFFVKKNGTDYTITKSLYEDVQRQKDLSKSVLM